MTEHATAVAEQETPPEPEPDPDHEPEPAPEPAPEARCEAETTVGGTLYRCALETGHEDEHRFQPLLDEAAQPVETEKAVSKRLKSLENEAERHARRIGEIIGADAESLVQCELCPPNFGGWRFDVAPAEDVTQRVRAAIGLPDVSNFAMSATEKPCDDCRGLGRVRTGSQVPGRETALCDACGGDGYVASRPRLNAAPAQPAPVEAANGTSAPYDDGIKRDMFGTPEGDPDYGKLPNLRERPVEYWQQNRG